MASHREELATKGYTIVKGLLTKEAVEAARKATLDYFETEATLDNANGKYLPDFLNVEELSAVGALRNIPKLLQILSECFDGKPYRFCGHCDIGVNRVVSGWHKDLLNGAFVHYQKHDPWLPLPNGETYKIVKVAIYLEDHSADDSALQVVPGSHLRRDLGTAGAIRLRPEIGDVIIFDQRITHRGMERQVDGARILISYGFGVENEFTDHFEAGTRARQIAQLRTLPKIGNAQ